MEIKLNIDGLAEAELIDLNNRIVSVSRLYRVGSATPNCLGMPRPF